MRRKKSRRINKVASFINLLKLMLDKQSSDDICWNDDELSFRIKNHSRFTEQILPKYFKHQNFASFIRQLNIYNFRKITLNQKYPDQYIYLHQSFKKNKPELLKNIKRKMNKLQYKQKIKLKNSIFHQRMIKDNDNKHQKNQKYKQKKYRKIKQIYNNQNNLHYLNFEYQLQIQYQFKQSQKKQQIILKIQKLREQNNKLQQENITIKKYVKQRQINKLYTLKILNSLLINTYVMQYVNLSQKIQKQLNQQSKLIQKFQLNQKQQKTNEQFHRNTIQQYKKDINNNSNWNTTIIQINNNYVNKQSLNKVKLKNQNISTSQLDSNKNSEYQRKNNHKL